MCACIREFKVKRSIQTLISYWSSLFVSFIPTKVYSINQIKFNTRRKLTISISLTACPKVARPQWKRVRACESGQSVIETRYLLFSNAIGDDIVLDKYILFPQKYRKFAYGLFILYFMKCYPSDFRAPQCWKRNAHLRKTLTFSWKNDYLFYARKSDWADDTTFLYGGLQLSPCYKFILPLHFIVVECIYF